MTRVMAQLHIRVLKRSNDVYEINYCPSTKLFSVYFRKTVAGSDNPDVSQSMLINGRFFIGQITFLNPYWGLLILHPN